LSYRVKIFASEILRHLALLLASWLLGYWLGYPSTGLAVGLILIVFYLYWKLFRYFNWIESNEKSHGSEKNQLFSVYYHRFGQSINTLSSRIEKLSSILDKLPESLIHLDERSRVTWLNRSAVELLDTTVADAVGKPISDLFKKADMNRFLNTISHNQPAEFDYPKKSGSRLSANIAELGDHSRLLLIRDISELYRFEATRQDFISSASHELRTPLAVISGYLESIADSTSAELRTPISTMRDQARRMEQIIEDLLLLARLETPPQKIEHLLKPVNMQSLLAKIKKEALVIDNNRHHIAFECDSDISLRGIEKELHSAFSNLVQNAIKYTPPGGKISVLWQTQDGKAIFQVTDNGPGIAKEHLPLLTERFYRVNISRSRETGGTGLGLSIVSRVLKRHNSKLSIQSTPGEGSSFTCEFSGNALS
jgi:two-component system phosphate regulon sensor histidine kinase PhoR